MIFFFSSSYTTEIFISFSNAINILFFKKPEITLTHRCDSWQEVYGSLQNVSPGVCDGLVRSMAAGSVQTQPGCHPWALVPAASGASFILGGDPVEGSCLAQDL